MQFPDEKPQMCESCKERPAVTKLTYPRTGWSGMLCAVCFDRLTFEIAYNDTMSHVQDLRRNEQYDEALACLDELLEANRHRDPEKRLARNIAKDRAYT